MGWTPLLDRESKVLNASCHWDDFEQLETTMLKLIAFASPCRLLRISRAASHCTEEAHAERTALMQMSFERSSRSWTAASQATALAQVLLQALQDISEGRMFTKTKVERSSRACSQVVSSSPWQQLMAELMVITSRLICTDSIARSCSIDSLQELSLRKLLTAELKVTTSGVSSIDAST